MLEDDRSAKPPAETPDDRIIIRSPLNLAIFAMAILAVGTMALALISDTTPLVS